MTNLLGKQLRENEKKPVRVRPAGDYVNSVEALLIRKDGRDGQRIGWYVNGVQIPIGEIQSAMCVRGCLDIEVTPNFFKSGLNEWYFR